VTGAVAAYVHPSFTTVAQDDVGWGRAATRAMLDFVGRLTTIGSVIAGACVLLEGIQPSSRLCRAEVESQPLASARGWLSATIDRRPRTVSTSRFTALAPAAACGLHRRVARDTLDTATA
jgi:hypothetical protein